MPQKSGSLSLEASRVLAGDDRARYDGFTRLLHWLTVALVVAQFALSQTWGFAPRPTRHLMIVAHMSFGILLAATVLVRIVWRLIPGHRARPASTGPTEWLAFAVHMLLYAMLVAEAVLGFTLRWSGGEAMSLFGLPLPAPFAPWPKPEREFVGQAHEWLGWGIVLLASGHALAALFHHFVLKDDVLWRMLPGAAARAEAARAPSPEQAAATRRT